MGVDDATIKVERHGMGENGNGGPSIGDRVWLSWKPEDAVLLECAIR